MSFKDDFTNADGWSAADVSTRLNNGTGEAFLSFLRSKGVDTVIRYYASSARPKTITLEEAKFLSEQGFAILPVFQDSSRSISNFSAAAGTADAKSASNFANRIGQPIGQGSTIIFAVDADYSTTEIDGPILDYFRAVHAELGAEFEIGAYGSGAVLSKLQSEGLITFPWLAMSRLFLGTENFFYSDRWSMRQVPPEQLYASSRIGYDRNVLRVPRREMGAYQVDADGNGSLAWRDDEDATLGGHGSLVSTVEDDPGGADRYVATDGLRLRSFPNGPIMQELTIGEKVVDLGAAGEAGWRRVRAGSEQGVAYGQYLREPDRPDLEALLRAALDEWLRFDKGRADETMDPHCGYVRQMWAAIGEPWDGRSRYADGSEVPWSAAFISWVVRQAGPAYANFQFASRHSVFVNNAIKARVTGRADKPFWGYRIAEMRPEIGDIVQRNRGSGSFSYSYAENHIQYASHSDIIVEVTPDVVRVVGGNVDDTVGLGGDPQELALDADGFIRSDQRVITLLKNRAGLPP